MHRMKLFTLFTSAILFYREDWKRFVRFDAARKDVEKVKLWRTGAWLSVEGYSAELYIATRARDPQNFCLRSKRSHSSRTKYEPFFPLPHTPPSSFFRSRPIFRASRMRKLLLATRYFVRMERERLLRRQQNFDKSPPCWMPKLFDEWSILPKQVDCFFLPSS